MDIEQLVNALTEKELVEAGEAWHRSQNELKHARWLRAWEDGIEYEMQGETKRFPCSRGVAEFLAGVVKAHAYELEESITEEQWGILDAQARQFGSKFSTVVKDRDEFNAWLAAIMQPLVTAVCLPRAYQISENGDGTFGITVFNVPLPGLERISNRELRMVL